MKTEQRTWSVKEIDGNTTANRTPGEWKPNDGTIYVKEGDHTTIEHIAFMSKKGRDPKQWKADEAMICLAVNSHEELVAALTEAKQYIVDHMDKLPPDNVRVRFNALKALNHADPSFKESNNLKA